MFHENNKVKIHPIGMATFKKRFKTKRWINYILNMPSKLANSLHSIKKGFIQKLRTREFSRLKSGQNIRVSETYLDCYTVEYQNLNTQNLDAILSSLNAEIRTS